MPRTDEVPGALTPEALERVVLEIGRERGATGGSSVAVGMIADRVLAGRAFGSEAERRKAQLRIGQEVARLASQVEGLRYFENE